MDLFGNHSPTFSAADAESFPILVLWGDQVCTFVSGSTFCAPMVASFDYSFAFTCCYMDASVFDDDN
jgi:hypothetical protein